MLSSTFLCLLAVGLKARLSFAIPTSLNIRDSDPPYDATIADLDSSLFCPSGTNNTHGIALLVHGTGDDGLEVWGSGPYLNYLPKETGIAACYVNLPDRALGDVQLPSQYVAYNIHKLAPLSITGQIITIGHSQAGGITIQGALLYFPSTRPFVSRYISIAGDFHGALLGPFVCTAEFILRTGCVASVIQQSPGSIYLNAQNQRGYTALVPTTSIYSRTDEIVLDNLLLPVPSSFLPNASNVAIQDLCGPLHVVGHFGQLFDPAVYAVAKLAIAAGDRPTPVNEFNVASCTSFLSDPLSILTSGAAAATGLTTTLAGAILIHPVVHKEPTLKQYICDAGDAPQAQCNP